MKRMMLILLLLSCISVLLLAKTAKTDWDKYGFKGKVKSCEKIAANAEYKMLITFDANGKETSNVSMDYDPDTKTYVVIYTRTFKYDANNNLIEKLVTGNDEPSTIICKYNAKNQLIEELNTSDKSSVKYTYDDKGNQTEKLTYSSDSETPSKTVSIYDAAGNEIECDQYNNGGELEWKNFYQYNEKGQMIDFYRTALVFGYDEETDEEDTFEDTTVTRKAEYNEQGLISRQVTVSQDMYIMSSSITYTYTIDKMGNWTKRTTRNEGEEPISETQVIEYY